MSLITTLLVGLKLFKGFTVDDKENNWDDWDNSPISNDDECEPSDDDDDEDDSEEFFTKDRKKTSSNKGHFTAWEDQIIRDEWMTSTDEEIGERIGRAPEAIARRRKSLGLSKKNGRPKKEMRKRSILANPTEYSLSKLSKDDRIEFYKNKFDQNHRYGWLLQILMEDEIEYYKRKYIETLDSLDSVTHQEEDLLHSMIMKEIQILRLQSQMKEQLQRYNDDDDEERRPPAQYLYQDLDKAEQQYVKYQEKLKLTREQRLKTDREEKITIAAIVREFQDAENKHRAGEMAGQLSYYTNKCKEDMLKMQFLIGE